MPITIDINIQSIWAQNPMPLGVDEAIRQAVIKGCAQNEITLQRVEEG